MPDTYGIRISNLLHDVRLYVITDDICENAMKQFTLEVTFCEDRKIQWSVNSNTIDELITWWQEQVDSFQSEDLDGHETTQHLVIDLLSKDLDQTDPGSVEHACSAVLWLVANGEFGKIALPFMRRGDMTVFYEITKVGINQFRCRTMFDGDAQRAMTL